MDGPHLEERGVCSPHRAWGRVPVRIVEYQSRASLHGERVSGLDGCHGRVHKQQHEEGKVRGSMMSDPEGRRFCNERQTLDILLHIAQR